MLYLNLLKNLFRIHKIKTFLFMSLTSFLFLISISQNRVNSFSKSLIEINQPLAYFHALIDSNSSLESLRRKLMRIPGVIKVESKENKKLRNYANQILAELDLNSSVLNTENLKGLRIFLLPKIEQSKVKLIQQYIKRSNGQAEVTFSELKRTEVVKRAGKTYFEILTVYSYEIVLTFSFCVWLILLLSMREGMAKHIYLFERFHRESGLGIKIISFMIMISVFIGLTSGLMIGGQSYVYLIATFVLMTTLSALIFRKNIWS